MKIKWKLSLQLSIIVFAVMSVWALFFYSIMVAEIHDEVDDSLERYAEVVVPSYLHGETIPDFEDGYNNVYTITPLSKEAAESRMYITFSDTTVYLKSRSETEPARKISLVFRDYNGNYNLLEAMTPTFERDDLMETVLNWVIILYLVLTITIITVTLTVIHIGLKPLDHLIGWLKSYSPGEKNMRLPSEACQGEFIQIARAVNDATDRSEQIIKSQKEFIANAAHELQTPLAIIGLQVEMASNEPGLSENQMKCFHRIMQIQRKASRLNRTLLILAKVESGQPITSDNVNLEESVREQIEIFSEMFEGKEVSIKTDRLSPLSLTMNQDLLSLLVGNLLKNACSYSKPGDTVYISMNGTKMHISNPGTGPLDRDSLFERFRQTGTKDSNGLGLALVKAVCDRYSLELDYYFDNRNFHNFVIDFRFATES